MLLVRHGQSTWNAEGRWQGWADPPLSELGAAQARAAAEHLHDARVIVASDLARARETAEILAKGAGVGDVETFRGLRERGAGDWTGLTRAEITQRWPNAFSSDERTEPPGAEPMPTLLGRVVATIHRIAARADGGAVVAVTHGGVIRSLERHLGIDPEPLPNLAGRWIDVDGGQLAAGDRVLLIEPDEVQVTTPQQL